MCFSSRPRSFCTTQMLVVALVPFLLLANSFGASVSPTPSVGGPLAFDDGKSWSPNEPMSGDDAIVDMKV